MELHEVKTTVLIQQVKLNVRFPGQLSFSFKNRISFSTQLTFIRRWTKCTLSPTASVQF